MAISRRQFLKRTGLATAGTLLAPSIFRNPFVQRAFADTIGDRYLVVLFLDGGNDGLNTVPPYDDGTTGALRAAYEGARRANAGGIRLIQADLGATQIGACPGTGTPMALHPGMSAFKSLYDLGKLAVVQGCGYPDYNLSHEVSRGIWQSANPTSISGYSAGWLGRYFQQAAYGGIDIPGYCCDSEVAAEFRQSVTSILAANNLDDLLFPYDGFDSSDDAAKRACFEALYGAAATSPQASKNYLGVVGSSTLAATDSYPLLPLSPLENDYTLLDSNTGYSFRQIARVINAVRNGDPNVSTRHFFTSQGGFDTHSDQGANLVDVNNPPQHWSILKEFSDAINVFYNDCIAMGVENKVLVMVYSEFARRIEQNDNGTDHGSQGPVFVIGGSVNGGVYGNCPDLNGTDDNGNTVYSQTVGNPYRSTDIRDIYGTILEHWLNITPTTISNFILPTDTIVDPDNYWNTPNFDMGFL